MKSLMKNILQKIQSMKVAVIGDFCLDVYWTADMTKSELSRETPQFPLPIVVSNRWSIQYDCFGSMLGIFLSMAFSFQFHYLAANSVMMFLTVSYSVATGNCGNSRFTFSDGRNKMPTPASASIDVSL